MYEDERCTYPVLGPQERVLIITRRLFAGDIRRHLVGIVERYDPGVMRVRGYAFVYDPEKRAFERRPTPMELLIQLDNHIVVFILPEETEIGSVKYEVAEDGGLLVTDHKQFRLELDEFNR